jgi:hypothetical protein
MTHYDARISLDGELIASAQFEDYDALWLWLVVEGDNAIAAWNIDTGASHRPARLEIHVDRTICPLEETRLGARAGLPVKRDEWVSIRDSTAFPVRGSASLRRSPHDRQ